MTTNIERLGGLLAALPDGEAIAARILADISATHAQRTRAAAVADEPADSGRDICLRAAARLVGVGVPRLQRLIREGKLSARRYGGTDSVPRLKVNADEVRRAWADAMTYTPAGTTAKAAAKPAGRQVHGYVHPAFRHLVGTRPAGRGGVGPDERDNP